MERILKPGEYHLLRLSSDRFYFRAIPRNPSEKDTNQACLAMIRENRSSVREILRMLQDDPASVDFAISSFDFANGTLVLSGGSQNPKLPIHVEARLHSVRLLMVEYPGLRVSESGLPSGLK